LHRLAAGKVSLDSSVIVDFHLVGRLALLEELFLGRLLMSDFVGQELLDASLQLRGVATVALSTDGEWEFFRKLRRDRAGLGLGELGAICVARFHEAILVTNDRQARLAAEEAGIPVHGGIGVLECAVEVERLPPAEAIEVLEEMITRGAWISEEIAAEFRKRALGSC
jgi:predicted nucleic acid-binding protein